MEGAPGAKVPVRGSQGAAAALPIGRRPAGAEGRGAALAVGVAEVRVAALVVGVAEVRVADAAWVVAEAGVSRTRC
jgi:hypothetical protein